MGKKTNPLLLAEEAKYIIETSGIPEVGDSIRNKDNFHGCSFMTEADAIAQPSGLTVLISKSSHWTANAIQTYMRCRHTLNFPRKLLSELVEAIREQGDPYIITCWHRGVDLHVIDSQGYPAYVMPASSLKPSHAARNNERDSK